MNNLIYTLILKSEPLLHKLLKLIIQRKEQQNNMRLRNCKSIKSINEWRSRALPIYFPSSFRVHGNWKIMLNDFFNKTTRTCYKNGDTQGQINSHRSISDAIKLMKAYYPEVEPIEILKYCYRQCRRNNYDRWFCPNIHKFVLTHKDQFFYPVRHRRNEMLSPTEFGGLSLKELTELDG